MYRMTCVEQTPDSQTNTLAKTAVEQPFKTKSQKQQASNLNDLKRVV